MIKLTFLYGGVGLINKSLESSNPRDLLCYLASLAAFIIALKSGLVETSFTYSA